MFVTRIFLVFVTIVVVISDAAQKHCHMISIDRLIAFGDSTLDTGNVYNLTNQIYPPSPPYFKGQYSNGPNSVVRLVEKINKIQNSRQDLLFENYAYGGATTDNQLVQGFSYNNISVPGLFQQIDSYINKHNDTSNKWQKHTLYLLSAGSNNFFDNQLSSSDDIANSLIQSVKRLILFGARHVYLLSGAPGQYSPVITGQGNVQLNAYVEALAVRIDDLLSNDTMELKRKVTLIDIYTPIVKAIQNPSAYGFTDNSTPCVILNPDTSSILSVCTNPNEHIFWDWIHYSTGVQELIAETIFKKFKEQRKK